MGYLRQQFGRGRQAHRLWYPRRDTRGCRFIIISSNMQNVETMSEMELEQLQEKIDAGILLAQQRLKERVKKENGELVVMRDGKVTHLKADEIE